jgi:hypothetical protein
MQMRHWFLLVLCWVVGWGCGASAPIRPSSSAPMQSSYPAAAPQQSVGAAPAAEASDVSAPAPASAPVAKASGSAESQVLAQPKKEERPGLATQFGENLQRSVTHTHFYRESNTQPFTTTTIWYNDSTGAEALASRAQQRSGDRAEVELLQGGLVVGLVDENAQLLRGFVADGRPYAIGEANARYAIRINNRSDFTFEVVASVDGLSVIDGRPASFERRGYMLGPRQEIMIEGFRTSDDAIAAFRFGKVSQSYSVQMGRGDRNVGVVGVAFFQEKGQTPIYPSRDTQLRQDANPFPGQYAPRPPGR